MLNGPSLLDLDFRAALFELLLHGVGFFLGHTSLDGLRSPFHEILGFLEAEIREFANHLDDLNLLLGRRRRQNDVKRGLLLGRSGGGSTARQAPQRGQPELRP